MSTAPKPKFLVSARYIGPVFSLDGELTKHDQNLLFARNGTGKSFLSRAFRCLDLYGQEKDVSVEALNLLSDEAGDGAGSFTFRLGDTDMGSLTLQKDGDQVTPKVAPDTIFHVFSEDFVQEELRERKYELDGKIEDQIAIDSENIELGDQRNKLVDARKTKTKLTSKIENKFDNEKNEELHKKAEIDKRLKEFKELSLENLLNNFSEKPEPPNQSLAPIVRDLDSLKAIPAEPEYPGNVEAVGINEIDLDALAASLARETSPSRVPDAIKKKLNVHHSFYKTGTKIVQDEGRTECPFCEQGITAPDPKAIIDAYVSYFADQEEKHKEELRDYDGKLNQKEMNLKETGKQLAQQKSCFDHLKLHIPSQKNVELADGKTLIEEIIIKIHKIKQLLGQKSQDLAYGCSINVDDITAHIEKISGIIQNNNEKISEFTKSVAKKDNERKELQRKACKIFEEYFAFSNWNEIEDLRKCGETVQNEQKKLSDLEKANPSANARDRVAETFAMLLKAFFADKYAFDSESFTLKRHDKNITRGLHRTLSDGEKTVIAFCYFVACVHRKVKSDSDYKKLFLIFDDPVTSMSYDFIFSIGQVLKNLRISDQGEVSITPITQRKIDKNIKPKLLILTHSSYFFNISRTNRVINDNATFSLHRVGASHKLTPLKSYITPFEQQLEHVNCVAKDQDPDHSTGNAIRQVLEAVGRFCRPDKSDSLQNFIEFLVEDADFSIKSMLINSLSHGSYYDEMPSPDDLKSACREAIAVVEKFAVGQLEILKHQME
ncbi:MAG: AAA family ATPase [Rhodospirillales bacterium]|nr:AAA family ATPase [Rhodospirillales bacterium]